MSDEAIVVKPQDEPDWDAIKKHEVAQEDDIAHLRIQEVETMIQDLLAAEHKLEHGYATLGSLLAEVQSNKYWQALGYPSFGKYIAHLSETYNKGRSQLYHYFGTVKELAPFIAKEELNEMGISKAAELKPFARAGTLTPEIIEQAKNPKTTVKDLRKILFDSDQPEGTPTTPKGEWLDLEAAFYVTADEKSEILDALKAAANTDPIEPVGSKPWQKMKNIIIKMSREYLSSNPPHPEEGIQ
jgi:hypothetical protein